MSDIGLALHISQCDDIENMRSTLTTFNKRDPQSARKALQNVTILRVYHQVSRIVKYLDLVDRMEDKIYSSIDSKLDSSDPDDPELYFSLIPVLERLQKIMIDSHKLLEPYLNVEQMASLEVPVADDPSQAFASMILDQESREKVRTSAQEVLAAISTLDSNEAAAESDKVKSKAQAALDKLDDESSTTEENDG